MKTNFVILSIIFGFFMVASAVYTYWSIVDTGEIEWAGSIALLLTGIMAAMIAGYLWWAVMRPDKGLLAAQDHPEAEIDDDDPELGHFSPFSWWPILLAGALAIFVMGIAISTFMLPIGLALIVITMVGWVYEYYRGHFVQR